MVRVRLANAEPLDPALAAAGPAAARRALEALHGVLSIEVDGVDLTGGRVEGPALATLEALLAGLARLQAGFNAAAAPLRPGELLLLLRRHGSAALLTLVELGPPARLPVVDLEVDLAALTAAALEGAAELCRALAPAPAAEAAAARRLRQASRGAQPPEPAAPGRGSGGAPSQAPNGAPGGAAPVRVEVQLDPDGVEAAGGAGDLAGLLVPGRVTIAAAGRRLVLDGLPFLTLRDLVDGLEEAARAAQRREDRLTLRLGRAGRAGDADLELDLAAGLVTLDRGGAVAVTALELAGAVSAAVLELGRALAPGGQPEPRPELLELADAAGCAAAHLAEQALGDLHLGQAPAPAPRPAGGPSQQALAPGRLRRVALRAAWRVHVGEPVGPGLAEAGGAVLALGREAVAGRRAGRTWLAPGADWAALAAGLLLLRRGDELSALEPASGRVRWRRPALESHPTGAAGRRGGPVLLAEAGALSALDPATGAVRWRLPLPGGHGLALAALGPLVAAGSGSGLVHALDLSGRLAWRIRAPGPALAPPLLLGPALASVHAAGPGATVLLLDPATGRRLGEAPLDAAPAGAPLRWAGGLALAGRSGGAAAVTLVRTAAGRAWTVEAPLGGTPRLAAAGGLLLAGDAEGALACLDRTGRTVWSLAPSPGGGGAAPVALRGVVLAARGGLELLDLATGRALGAVPGLHPARLLAAGALSVTALEADGDVTGLAAAGPLSLVAGGAP